MLTAAEARKVYEQSADSALQKSLSLIDEHIRGTCSTRKVLSIDSEKLKGDHKEIVASLESRGFKAKFHYCQREGCWLEVSW